MQRFSLRRAMNIKEHKFIVAPFKGSSAVITAECGGEQALTAPGKKLQHQNVCALEKEEGGSQSLGSKGQRPVSQYSTAHNVLSSFKAVASVQTLNTWNSRFINFLKPSNHTKLLVL